MTAGWTLVYGNGLVVVFFAFLYWQGWAFEHTVIGMLTAIALMLVGSTEVRR